MNTTTSKIPVTNVLAYHHAGVVRRLQDDLKISIEDADSIFDDTKRFLFLCGTQRGPFAPTERIDHGWHSFILYTRDYADFCSRCFGRFIHHVPTDRDAIKPGRADIVARTFEAARAAFGELSPNWHSPNNDLCEDYKCKGCDNWE